MATGSGGTPGRKAHAVPGRSPVRVDAIGAGLVLAAGGLLVNPASPTGALLTTVERDIALVDNWSLDSPGVVAAAMGDAAAAAAVPFPAASTLNQSLYYVFNDLLGIGNKTPAQLFPPGDTVGDLLGYSGLSTSTTLGSTSPNVMHLLGLDAIKFGDVVNALGLNTTKSVDAILDQLKIGNVTLDFLLTPLGIPSTQTTLGLAHRFSVAHMTLGQLMNSAGYSPSSTLGQLIDRMGLGGTALPGLMGAGGLIGAMTCPTNIASGMTVDQFLQCLLLDGIKAGGTDTKGHNLPTEIHVNQNTTIEQLLSSQHFYDSNSNLTSRVIGTWTLGEILSQRAGSPSIPAGQTPFIWNTTTTVKDWINHIHVNTGVTTDPQGGVPQLIYPYGTGAGTGSPVYEQSPGNDNGGAAVPPGSTSQMLPTLGSMNFGTILTWMNLDPNKSLADIVTNLFWVGNHTLGSSTIGDVLDGLVVNPLAIGPIGSEVTDSTTVAQLFEGMFGSLTINDMLNLAP